MTTTRTIKATCLNCQQELDGATSLVVDHGPKPGDATVCAYCGHLMIFTDNLGLRDPTPAEIDELAGNQQLLDAQRFGAMFRDTKN